MLVKHQDNGLGPGLRLLDLDMKPVNQLLLKLTYLPTRLFLYNETKLLLAGQRTFPGYPDSGLYYSLVNSDRQTLQTTSGCTNI